MPRRSAPAPLPELRDGFKFRAGHPALDLPATVAGRLKPQPTDLLASPADLDRWLVAAGLVASPPGASNADLREARELREALFHLARARVAHEPFAPADTAIVNRLSLVPPPSPQLGPRGLSWRSANARSLLALVARAGAELLGGEAGARIRACSGPGCSILFLDLSRGGDRRWCSMAACGNRAKVAAFRNRNN